MKESYKSLAPLYAACFVVLFCGISAVNSTIENSNLTFTTTLLLALGVFSSLWMRIQGADQRVVIWLASGLAVLLFLIHPSISDFQRGYAVTGDTENLSSGGIGIVLEWLTVLFSFTLLTNHSLLFAIVPSMALIGLMSSENLNPEMVTYFLGFILSTVFLMGYHAHLDRTNGALQQAPDRPIPIRPFVVLTTGVVAGAFILGIAASSPLKLVGRQVFTVASSKIPNSPISFLPVNLTGTDNTLSLSGQPPNLTNEEVMRVKSRVPMYWRGGVLDNYTGSNWDNNAQFHEIYPVEINLAGNNVYNLDEAREVRSLRDREVLDQIVTTRSFSKAVHAAGEPIRVMGPFDHLNVDYHLTVQSDWNQNQELSYSVTSLVSHAKPDDLRKAPRLDRRDENIQLNYGRGRFRGFDQYRQLPDRNSSAYDRVKLRAEQVTQGLTNNYDRAEAIAEYLRTRFTYTLEPPLLPSDTDAAEFFIFQSRSGYCEQFANAMAVMLRTLGIPARIAVGYAPGDWDASTQEWVVRDMDAHAWVEVFFPTYGWITFDPTGSMEPEQPGFLSIGKMMNRLMRMFTSRQFLPSLILIAILTTLIYVLKTEAYDRYLRASVEDWLRYRRAKGAPDPRWAIEKNYQRLRRTLRKMGVPAAPSQTPFEVQEAAVERLEGSEEAIRPLEQMTQLYVQAAYSNRPVAAGSDKASDVWLRQFKEAVKRPARR